MIWLTWRQHRKQALFAVLGLLALAVALGPLGLRMHRAVDDLGITACLRQLGTAEFVSVQREIACSQLTERFRAEFAGMDLLIALLVFVPLLFGMFFGAPLVARELEHGTHRFVWTQGVTRLRWATVKIGLVVVGVLVLSVAGSALTTWWLTPLLDTGESRFIFPYFDLYGLAPVGYALFAVALGMFAGTVTHRVLPAMAVTVVGFVGARLAVTVLARPRYQAPLKRTFPVATDSVPNPASDDGRINSDVYDAAGNLVSPNSMHICPPIGQGCPDTGQLNVVTYQPGGRFWLFQYIEFGLYAALAVLLIGLTIHQVRRRIG